MTELNPPKHSLRLVIGKWFKAEATGLGIIPAALLTPLVLLLLWFAQQGLLPHPRSTKVSMTFFSPALSKATVSLLPSTMATVPMPNLRWKTRSPRL